MKWRLCLLVLAIIAGIPTIAQPIVFRNFSVADGLPSSTVRAITQDCQGYLWFGTKNGLSRFDGYQFKNYQFKNGDSSSLGNNFIHCITVYDSTRLWVGTENSIYVLDLQTERFTQFAPLKGLAVFEIIPEEDGALWISTRFNGLYRYQRESGKLENFAVNGTAASVSSNLITKLAADQEGNIWIGTYGFGLNVYNRKTGKFSVIRAGENGLTNDFINTIYTGKDGTVWVGTMNGGLCRWDSAKQSFIVYRKDGTARSLQDNIVRAVCEIAGGKLLIGTEKGLNKLDLARDTMAGYSFHSDDPFSISDNSVYSIFVDKSATVWVGTFFGGVNYFPEQGSPFEYFYPNGAAHSIKGRAVSSFLEDRPGYFWVGTEDAGLHYFDAQSGRFMQYPFKPGQAPLSYHNIHSLIKDREGKIWTGIFAGGVNVLDPVSGRVKYYAHEAGNPESLNSNNVFEVYQDRDDTIWVGTDKGLNQFDAGSGKFIRIQEKGVTNTIIYDVYEDASKTVWVATYNNGLYSYQKKNGKWNSVKLMDEAGGLASNKLTTLLDDQIGHLWIGSDGGGLYKYHFQSRATKLYNPSTGLNANVIFGIRQDDAGNIWVTTNNGIYSIDPVSDKIRHFTWQDNLQSRQFNYNAFYKASDGKLLAGGIRGFNSFYPDQFSERVHPLNVRFTNFQLFNKSVEPGEEGSPLQKQIGFTKELELNHHQSVISFEYAALNSGGSEKINYAYLMEGFDKDWNYVQDQRKATYTNLSPGTYRFRVKASLEEGGTEGTETVLKLVILPPVYKTNLAYLIYFILFCTLLYGLYNYFLAYIRRQNQIKLERLKNKEEQEFYARKIEFFTVMAHEIRTPLSLIIAPLEKLLASNRWAGEEKQQLQVMDNNAERLMGLVNQLLDFRRIESDAYEIRKEPVEIVSLVQSVYSRFFTIPYQKNVEFTMSTQISNRLVEADPEVMDKILSNLLINAFKFARTRVVLSIMETSWLGTEDSAISISVEDDGIGIPATNLANIFNRFFTTARGNHEYNNLGGSGIGLALSSALAEKHGARLRVESREGVKTRFTLELPADRLIQEEIRPQWNEEEAPVQVPNQPLVLVVEDDPAIRNFVAGSFQSDLYNVVTAANGRQALQLLEEKEVDLILSDWMMPEMDGVEFCRAVKSNLAFSHIPFILLTAKGSREAEIEGIETGADAYIMKPFKWKHLIAVARNLIESREQLRQKYAEQPQSEVGVLTTNIQDKEFMENVVKIIEDRIMDPQFSVEELSRDLSMSRSNLHKKLKSLSGYVPNELIKLVKLKHAAKLLRNGSNTMAEVAYLSGFNSPSYFSKCFQQQFQVSPKEYADRMSGKGSITLEDLE